MSRRKGKRSRFRKATDALEQLESIEKQQAGFRRGKKGQKIERTDKSLQRFHNANRNLRRREEFEEEYD